jgi:putative multiple sugar transport system substrate-binding protein
VRRRLVTIAVGAALTLGLTACGGSGAGGGSGAPSGAAPASQAPADTLVGVSMPTQTSERWIADGNNVKQKLEAAGYKVSLQYANDDIPTQSQQIDQMITQGADVLVIAAIDGTAISSQLQAAKAQNIPVIAYDRLIRNSPNVDY